MDDEAALNPSPCDDQQESAADHDHNFLSRPIPFAIRNSVFGTVLGVLLALIQVYYQESKGALVLFDKKYHVNMELLLSAFILFLSATVAERTITCFGGYVRCLTTISWKHLFGHVADVLSTSVIVLLTSVLPSSVKIVKYTTYILCACPTLRLITIFLVTPLVEFIIYKYCSFGVIGGDNNGGAVDTENNGDGDGGGGVGEDGFGGCKDDDDHGGEGGNNHGAIEMSSL